MMRAAHPGGLWAEVRFELDGQTGWREVARAVHHALRVDLKAVYKRSASNEENPDWLIGRSMGHECWLWVRERREAVLQLGHWSDFGLGTGHQAYEELAPKLSGRDISHAIATIFRSTAGEPWPVRSWGLPDPVLPLLGSPDSVARCAPPPAHSLTLTLDIETPSWMLEPHVIDLVRPSLPPYDHLVCPVEIGMVAPFLVSQLIFYLDLWLTPGAIDPPDPRPVYVAEHLGMDLRLYVGSADTPRSRLVGTPAGGGADTLVIDVSEELGAVLWVLGNGLWRVSTPRGDVGGSEAC
jgi:hypothetical protein